MSVLFSTEEQEMEIVQWGSGAGVSVGKGVGAGVGVGVCVGLGAGVAVELGVGEGDTEGEPVGDAAGDAAEDFAGIGEKEGVAVGTDADGEGALFCWPGLTVGLGAIWGAAGSPPWKNTKTKIPTISTGSRSFQKFLFHCIAFPSQKPCRTQ